MSSSQSKTQTVFLPKEQTCCQRCCGEGQIPNRKRLKKQKKKRKHNNNINHYDDNNNNNNNQQETNTHPSNRTTMNMMPCSKCYGTGLVPTNENNNNNNNNNTNHITNTLNDNMEHVHHHHHHHVAIIGAGIGGLALALALQQRNIPYTIYERDTSFDQRSQGYGLTMQQGGRALKALGFDITSTHHHYHHNNDDNNDDNNNQRLFGKGIHSKRHLVHTPDGQVVGTWGMKVWGRPSQKTQDAKRQNIHIARQELRRLIYDQLLFKEERIQWGHRLMSYSQKDVQQNDASVVSMTFMRTMTNATSTSTQQEPQPKEEQVITNSATILVGADGIRSQVRSQKISDVTSPLRYLGCIVILGIAPSPQSSTLTSDGESVFQTADGTTRIYAMPFAQKGKETALAYQHWKKETNAIMINGNDRKKDVVPPAGETMWQLSFPLLEKDAIELSSKGASALRDEALKRVGHWHVPVPELVQHTPLKLITGYPVYDRDMVDLDIFRYGDGSSSGSDSNADCEHTKYDHVTLIGDAAHPMSPFKGQGANQALLDAVLLSRTIYRAFKDQGCTSATRNGLEKHNGESRICAEFRDFERQMMERSAVKMKASFDAAKFLHTDAAIAEGNVTRGAAAVIQHTDPQEES